MTDRKLTLSRRRLLGGVATLAAGSAATGAGVLAAFSDSESATGSITAGSFNLEVVSRNGQSYSGGPGSVTFLDKTGVMPGDSGTSTVKLRNAGTITGYLDVEVISVTDAENSLTDPEMDAGDDSENSGELADALEAQARVSGPRGDQYLCPGLSDDAPLSSVFVAGEVHSLNYELQPGETATFHLDWSLPSATGNEIQTDSVGLELAFQFDQTPDDDGTTSCSNDGSGNDESGGDDEKGDSRDLPQGVVFTQNNGTLSSLSADGASVTQFGGDTNKVVAIGPGTADFDGNDAADLPFLKNGSSLRLVDASSGSRKYKLTGGTKADTGKTILAVGTWNGVESVFYPGTGNAGIYQLTPGSSPQLVTQPGDGVSAVLGPGDIDDDGNNELLFVDDSKVVKYVTTDGRVESTGKTVGADNSVGAGPPAMFDGSVRVPIVDDSNKIHLLGPNGVTSTLITGSQNAQAAKAAVAATDIDGDGEPEVVFLDNSQSTLRYVDDVLSSGQKPIRDVTDAQRNPITAENKRGVLPGHTADSN